MSDDKSEPNRARLSIRWKIILPFVLLAALLGLGAVVLVNRQLGQAEQVRYLRQLRDSGQQAADEVVRLEARLLEVERLLANTQGVPEAVALNDAEQLRSLLLQSVVNSDTDVAVVLDREGTSLLAVRRARPDAAADYLTLRGETYYTAWPFVRQVLRLDTGGEAGDSPEKQAGLGRIQLDGQDVWVLFVAGPLVDEEGTVFGAVLTGRYLSKVVDELGDISGAHVSIYDTSDGELLATDFSDLSPGETSALVLSPDSASTAAEESPGEEPYRTIQIAGQSYGEVLTPFVARNGEVEMGLLGVSLLGGEDADTAYQEYQAQTRSVLVYAGIGLVLVIGVGLLVSQWITRPVDTLVDASRASAVGDVATYVPVGSREDNRFHDLISQTVTESARAELRKSLSNGDRPLAGRQVRAAMLSASIEGFAVNGRTKPEQTLHDLNRAYPAILAIINRHGGMLDSFNGLGLKASFGVLPRSLPAAVSTLQAVHAGLELIEYIRELNETRAAGGSTPLDIAIGISSGFVVAGGVEALGKIHFTVLGDTAEEVELIMRAAGSAPGSTLLISEQTHEDLGSARDYLTFGRKGDLQLPGSKSTLRVMEVAGRSTRLVDTSDLLEGDESEAGKEMFQG
ncbi:MAG: cache domain-containing protein [Anaerolineales bacterium]